MIWYLHWLEMRGGLFWALCFAVFAGFLNFPSAPTHEELIRFVALRGVFVGFFTGVMAGGDGLHGQSTLYGIPWHVHKLSLPIARRTLVLTRIAVTAAAATIICTLATGAFLVLAVRGGASLDLPALAIAHLYSVATAVASTAGLASLAVFLRPLPFVLAALGLLAVMLWNSEWAARLALESRVAWLGLAVLAGVASAGIATAVRQAPLREVV